MIRAEQLEVLLLQMIVTYFSGFMIEKEEEVGQLYFMASDNLPKMTQREKQLFDLTFKPLGVDKNYYYFDENFVTEKLGITIFMQRLLQDKERTPLPVGKLIQGHEPTFNNLPQHILTHFKNENLAVLANIAKVNEKIRNQVQVIKQRKDANKENDSSLAKLADIKKRLSQPRRNKNTITAPVRGSLSSVASPVPETIKSPAALPSFMRPTATSQARLSAKSVGRVSSIQSIY